MKKTVTVVLIFFLVGILCGCKKIAPVKDEFFSEETLEECNLKGLPKPAGKYACFSNYLYLFMTQEEYDTYKLEVTKYISEREDIVFWGTTEYAFYKVDVDIAPKPKYVYQYDSIEEYVTEKDFLSIPFTTMELDEEGKYQNCFGVCLDDIANQKILSNGEWFYYNHRMIIYEYTPADILYTQK